MSYRTGAPLEWIFMDDEAREEALKNQEARDREETRRRQREIDKAFIKKHGLKAWVSAPSADAGHSHIPHKYRFDIHRTGNPMATIQTITDAATASSAIRTIIVEGFNGMNERLKDKITDRKNDISRLDTYGHDSDGVLQDASALTAEVATYFEEFAETLASHDADNTQELAAKDKAESVSANIDGIRPEVTKVRERLIQIVGQLDEALTELDVVIQAGASVGEELQELVELINNIAT